MLKRKEMGNLNIIYLFSEKDLESMVLVQQLLTTPVTTNYSVSIIFLT